MQPNPTVRLDQQDSYLFEIPATVVAIRDHSIAFDRSCFYPGGGGQPSDTGKVILQDDGIIEISGVHKDENGVLWHTCDAEMPEAISGRIATLKLNVERRLAFMRYHTVLHILNTIVLLDYSGWMTGVQIAEDYSRIDFKVEIFSAIMCEELQTKVNEVLSKNLPLISYLISEIEFRSRNDLTRTLEVNPPVIDGQVRVVEIAGFDAQACGGTHVHSTSEVGSFLIQRTENKGKINKRLYVKLTI